jgi:hypothetical protein
MESIGQILKAARERRQISINDMVVATKMTSTFVKAIEADDFDALVAPVYARGFIKLYAGCVGLDPMPLLKKFDVSGRAAPVPAPLPSKAPTRKQEKIGGRSKTVRGAALANATALAAAAPLRMGVRAPLPSLPPSWWASLLAGRFSALPRMFGACVQWPRFSLPGKPAYSAVRSTAGRVFQYLPWPAIIWRRIFIVAFVVLLIIAASRAWECSHRGPPSTTDACRWLAEPPAPYLNMEARPVAPGK